MGFLEAVLMGIVQGMTEFLPVSSSGHLLLVPVFFGFDDPGAGFTAVIQIGTLFALFIYFWKDLVNVTRGWTRGLVDREARKTSDSKLGWAIVIGTIPVVIIGLLLEDQIDTAFRDPLITAIMLIGMALVLGLAELVGKRTKGIEKIGWKEGLIIGLWQCIALVPGSSRSGSCIAGGLFLGLERATAARFAFLLAIPAIGGSGFYKLFKEFDELMVEGFMPTMVATVVSFVSGYFAIWLLMKLLQKRTTLVFIVYRVILGGFILFLINQGMIDRA